MPFQKGHKKTGGRKKGVPDKKTEMWNAFGEYLVNEGAGRALEIIKGKEDPEYLAAFEKFLEYFKPKQQRADASGDQSININLHFDSDDASV